MKEKSRYRILSFELGQLVFQLHDLSLCTVQTLDGERILHITGTELGSECLRFRFQPFHPGIVLWIKLKKTTRVKRMRKDSSFLDQASYLRQKKDEFPDRIDLFQFKITRHQVRVSRFHLLPKISHILYGKKDHNRTQSPATVRAMPLLTQLSLVNLDFRFVFGHFGRRLLQLRHFIPQPFHIRHFLGQFFGFHNVRRQLVLQSFASAAKLVPRRLNSLQRVTQRRDFSVALLEFLISGRPVTTQR